MIRTHAGPWIHQRRALLDGASLPRPGGGLPAFYRELLGWECPDGASFERDGLIVAGILREAPAASWCSFVATEDADAAAGAAAAAGGTVLVPPTVDEHGRGRWTLFADPTGAVLGAWQRGSLSGSQVSNEPGTVCWTDLLTPAADRAAAFYRQVFGGRLRPAAYGDDIGPYDEWTASVARWPGCGRSPRTTSPTANWSMTVLVADCREAVAGTGELAGSVVLPPVDAVDRQLRRRHRPGRGAIRGDRLAPELLANII